MLENSVEVISSTCPISSLQWKLLGDIHSMPGVSGIGPEQTGMSVKGCTWKQS